MQHGSFFWYELVTQDREASKRFFTGLFGWQTHDAPTPGGDIYTTFMDENGDYLCGLIQNNPRQHWAKLPSHWMSYITVSNLDTASKRAQRFGGKVMAKPLEIPNIGTYQVIRDPAGAHLTIIETDQTLMPANYSQPGRVVWNELTSRRPDLARPFYRALVGWDCREAGGPFLYEFFAARNNNLAGLLSMQDDHWSPMPSQWNHYFSVENVDEILGAVTQHGGSITIPPFHVDGVGRVAIVAEPGGAPLSLLQAT